MKIISCAPYGGIPYFGCSKLELGASRMKRITFLYWNRGKRSTPHMHLLGLHALYANFELPSCASHLDLFLMYNTEMAWMIQSITYGSCGYSFIFLIQPSSLLLTDHL